jgi:tetratricopeptide (TPR) repeat protein
MKQAPYAVLALLFLLLLPEWSAAQTARTVMSAIDQGIKHSQAGRYDQALQAFDQALKLKPNDPALITYKATVYYAKGNNAQALQMCEQALKLDPNFSRAYYQRGMIYQSQEKYDKAVEDIAKAKSLGYGVDPDFIELLKRKAAAQK